MACGVGKPAAPRGACFPRQRVVAPQGRFSFLSRVFGSSASGWHLWHREISWYLQPATDSETTQCACMRAMKGYCERGAQKPNAPPTILIPRRAVHGTFHFKQFRKGVDAPFPNEINARPARRVGASTHPSICRTSSSPHAALLAGRRRNCLLALPDTGGSAIAGWFASGARFHRSRGRLGCERLLCRRLCLWRPRTKQIAPRQASAPSRPCRPRPRSLA